MLSYQLGFYAGPGEVVRWLDSDSVVAAEDQEKKCGRGLSERYDRGMVDSHESP